VSIKLEKKKFQLFVSIKLVRKVVLIICVNQVRQKSDINYFLPIKLNRKEVLFICTNQIREKEVSIICVNQTRQKSGFRRNRNILSLTKQILENIRIIQS